MIAPNNWTFTVQRPQFGPTFLHRYLDGRQMLFTWVLKNGKTPSKSDAISVYDTELMLYNAHVKRFDYIKTSSTSSSRRSVPRQTLTRMAELATITGSNAYLAALVL